MGPRQGNRVSMQLAGALVRALQRQRQPNRLPCAWTGPGWSSGSRARVLDRANSWAEPLRTCLICGQVFHVAPTVCWAGTAASDGVRATGVEDKGYRAGTGEAGLGASVGLAGAGVGDGGGAIEPMAHRRAS